MFGVFGLLSPHSTVVDLRAPSDSLRTTLSRIDAP
jgi:hypothetical protein